MLKKILSIALIIFSANIWALNPSVDEAILGFDEIQCGMPVQKAARLLPIPENSNYFGVPVISHQYIADPVNGTGSFRQLDTAFAFFDYYRSEAPQGYKFSLIGYERGIYLGPEKDQVQQLVNFEKVSDDLSKRLGLSLKINPLTKKETKESWWSYTQKSENTIYITLYVRPYKNNFYAVISSICEMEYMEASLSEKMLEKANKSGNLFK